MKTLPTWCDVCGTSFKWKDNLKAHKKACIKDITKKCDLICLKTKIDVVVAWVQPGETKVDALVVWVKPGETKIYAAVVSVQPGETAKNSLDISANRR